MRVRDVMTTNVRAARPDMTVREAATIMADQGFSALPVVDDQQRLLGILTELDIIQDCIPPYLQEQELDLDVLPPDYDVMAPMAARLGERRVSEVMTAEGLFTVEEDDAVIEVAVEMQRHGFTRVPVQREGRLVGIVTRSDIVRGLLHLDPPEGSTP